MRSDLFQHELGKTSAVFGRKNDVQVVFKGDGAATNGSTIYLPALDATATVDDDQAAIMRGYVDHEAGHVRHSDFDALKTLGEECQRTGNTLLRAVHNALEDVWLERRVIDEYRGAERNLRATATAVNKEFINAVPAGDPRLRDDNFVAAVAITWEGRKGYGGETCQQCLDLLDDDLRNALPTWVKGLDACNNSQDVIDLARIVENSIRTGDYKPEQPQEQEDEQDGQRGDTEAEGQESTAEQGDDPSDAGDDGAGDSTQGDGSDVGDGDGTGGSPQGQSASDDGCDKDGRGKGVGATPANAEVYDNFDVGNAMRSQLSQAGLMGHGLGTYRVMSTEHDKWHHRSDTARKYVNGNYGHRILSKGETAEYDRVVEAMAGDVNVMRRKLERALVAKQTRDWDNGREFGRLDTRRLTAAVAGRSNVFKLRSDRNEIDTAVTMLVDLSGSMRGFEARVALQCVCAIAEAIDRTGIKYELLGFNNRSEFVSQVTSTMAYPDGDEKYWGRIEPLDMYVFKAFDERLYEAKGAISQLPTCVGGHNTDGDGVSYAYDRLRKRPESRKVMLVFSDGLPTGHTGEEFQMQRLRDVTNMIDRDGVDLIGIGIGTTAVERFYPKYAVVNNVSELSGSVMDQLSRVLLGERFQIDNSKLMTVSYAI